jgi:hypothetical protein
MTIRFIEETATTAGDSESPSLAGEDSASTAASPFGSPLSKPGRFIAGVVLAAALSAGGPTGLATLTTGFGSRRRYAIAGESGTEAREVDLALQHEVQELFEQASSEFFQDGVHSYFSRRLLVLLAERGREAVQSIAIYLFSGQANPDVSSEALRWLAEFHDPATLSQRWSIFQRSLQDPSPRVRDGAILGFAALDDARALPVLADALSLEQITELRRLIEQVVDQLHSTTHGSSATNSKGESLA